MQYVCSSKTNVKPRVKGPRVSNRRSLPYAVSISVVEGPPARIRRRAQRKLTILLTTSFTVVALDAVRLNAQAKVCCCAFAYSEPDPGTGTGLMCESVHFQVHGECYPCLSSGEVCCVAEAVVVLNKNPY